MVSAALCRSCRPRAGLRAPFAVALSAIATAALPLATAAPRASAALASVVLIGVLSWLLARASVEDRPLELGFVAALATALLVPAGGSLLVPAALALARYRAPPPPRPANDNDAAPSDRWVPITPERAKVLLAATAA